MTAVSASSLTTTASKRSAKASSASAWAIRRAICSSSSAPRSSSRSRCTSRDGARQEHQQGVRDLLLDRHGALDVDLHEHVLAGREAALHLLPGRALELAVDLEPLQEPAGVPERLELARRLRNR